MGWLLHIAATAASATFESMGTTSLAVGVGILAWAVSLAYEAKKVNPSWTAAIKNARWRDNLGAGLLFVFVAWSLTFAAHAIGIVDREHEDAQTLREENARLKAQTPPPTPPPAAPTSTPPPQLSGANRSPAPKTSPAAPPGSIVFNAPNQGIATVGQSGGTNIIGATPNPNAPVIAYFYNGERSVRTANTIGKERAEIEVFKRLVQLHDAKDWPTLERECAAEISTVPDWLTPYLLRGVALSNLGRVPEAIKMLEHVEQERAGRTGNDGDPRYPGWAQAAGLLETLKARAAK